MLKNTHILQPYNLMYRKHAENFVIRCDKKYLNVSKMTCMCIDFKKNQNAPNQSQGESVERVDIYKYLCVVFNSKFNWKENISSVLKKVNSIKNKIKISFGQAHRCGAFNRITCIQYNNMFPHLFIHLERKKERKNEDCVHGC